METLPSGLVRINLRRNQKMIHGPAAETVPLAEAALKSLLADLAAAGDAGSLSLSRLAAHWLQNRKGLAPTTVDTYWKWQRAIARDPIGDARARTILATDIRAWFERSPVGPHSARKRLGWVHQLLRSIGNEERYRPPRLSRHSRRPLTTEEAARLDVEIAKLEGDEWLCLQICRCAGLRRSETAGLRHEDREEDGIRLRRSHTRTTGARHMRPKGKTAVSLSWIALPDKLLEHIGPPRKGYVLGGGTEPWTPDRVTNLVKRVCKRADIKGVPYLGSHTLRRTYGMTLLETGTDLITAAEQMRQTPEELARDYARSRQDLKRAAVARAFQQAKAPSKAPRRARRA